MGDQTVLTSSWRAELPPLSGRAVTLRELDPNDIGPVVQLLASADASRFGVDEPVTDFEAQSLIDRAAADRAAGRGFIYAIVLNATNSVIGLIQARSLDPAFEAAEWEFLIAPSMRGAGLFIEAAELAGSFAFGTVGAHRLEARVPVQNGRGNGALKKLGAVQEGVLRRSVRQRDEYVDQVLWSVLKDDWAVHWVSTERRVH